jgi:UDP-N-acetylglucosamine acyltransferase
MARIHSLASVDPAATVADDAEIGPFCVVGPDVVIGPGCRLLSHVHVAGRTSIGARTVIYPFASLGTPPQSTSYRGEPTRLVVGADCDIREGVSMNLGTAQGGGITSVGDHGFYMVNSHVGHDCHVGDNVVFANSVAVGGHCTVGNHVFIGGLSAVHQHSRIGEQAMISGVTGVRSDVIPFGLAIGSIGQLGGLNIIGMQRRKMSKERIATVRRAYGKLFFGPGVFADRIGEVEQAYGAEPAVATIIAFIRAKAARPLCRPGQHHEDY